MICVNNLKQRTKGLICVQSSEQKSIMIYYTAMQQTIFPKLQDTDLREAHTYLDGVKLDCWRHILPLTR